MTDKLDRDIEEILGNIEDFEWHRRQRRGHSRLRAAFNHGWSQAVTVLDRRLARISAGHLMLAGFLLLLAGLVFRLRGLGMWFVLAGILVFVAALLWSMRGDGKRSAKPRGVYWRDRYITYDNPPAASGLRAWFRRRRR